MRRIIKCLVIFGVLLLCIGAASAEEQTSSITVYLKNTEGTITIYQTDAYTEEDPEALAYFVKAHHVQGLTKPILTDKPTVFADLSQGRYLVVHEADAFRPFLVSLPIAINGELDFHVEAWPKTRDPQSPQTGDPMQLYPLLAVLFVSLLGMVVIKTIGKRSFAYGMMFANRVQNKQKRLR